LRTSGVTTKAIGSLAVTPKEEAGQEASRKAFRTPV
jgi:hypothetical protein